MCAGLADLFSDDFKDWHAENKVTVQSIIILRIPVFAADYDKFIILIASSFHGDEIAAVCINTKPTPRGNHIIINSRYARKSLNLGIKTEGCGKL